MLMVLVFIAISLMAMSAGYERLRHVTIAEAAGDRIAEDGDGSSEALGVAIARLQTGVPPEDPYTCRIRLRSSDGAQPLDFDVIHASIATDRWSVEARPADDSQPACPATFADSCPLVLP